MYVLVHRGAEVRVINLPVFRCITVLVHHCSTVLLIIEVSSNIEMLIYNISLCGPYCIEMAMSMSQSELQLMGKPEAIKSLMLKYFRLERGRNRRPANTDTAICRSCHRWVAAKNGNTLNLLIHLPAHHSTFCNGYCTFAQR